MRPSRMEVKEMKEAVSLTGGKQSTRDGTSLDDAGFNFVRRCIALLEGRGLEDQGLYRLVGVSSRVNRLLTHGLDPMKLERLSLNDPLEWESKTVTSALKTYFRNLPEPLMTFRLHTAFLDAAKLTSKSQRVMQIAALVRQLPRPNYDMLKLLVEHLVRVAAKSQSNLMTVSNLGVCFGPTLFRPEEDSLSAIVDIKYCNMVIEILITHAEKIFSSSPHFPRSPSTSSGLGLALSGARAIAAVVATAPGVVETDKNDDVSPIVPVSQSSGSTPSASQSDTTSEHEQQSPDVDSATVKPPNSSSHSSLVSALSLAPVTHTIVTSYSVQSPRPVVMEQTGSDRPRRQKPSPGPREHRLSSHELPQASSSRTFEPCSSSVPSSSFATARRQSPKKAVTNSNALSTSADSLSNTVISKRFPGLRSVNEEPSELHNVDFSVYGPASVDSGTVSRRQESSEARRKLFYRDTTQPHSLLDLRCAGGSVLCAPSVLMSKSMDEDPEREEGLVVSNGGNDGACGTSGMNSVNLKGKPSSFGYRPSPMPNLLNSSSSSTESLASTRSAKEPSSSPRSRAKLGFPNPPNYRSQEPLFLKSKLTGGLSSFSTSVYAASSGGKGSPSTLQLRRVRTLFACVGENESELSFQPNQIITNVRPSKEPGWLEGTLNGHRGLVPENYVEYLP